MINLINILLLMALGLANPGCSSSSSDDPATVPGSDTTVDDKTDTVAPAGAIELTIDDGSAVLAAAAEALGSTRSSVAPDSTTALRLIQSNATQSTNDPLCSTNAEPWDAASSGVIQDGRSDYAQRLFYCALFGNVVESSESVIGVLSQNLSIACTVETHFNVTTASYTTTETELVTNGPENVPLPAACWPQGQPDGITAVPFDSVKIQLLDSATTGWTHKLYLQSSAIDIEFTLKTFNSAGIFGFARSEGTAAAEGVGDDIRMTIDTTKGVMMFNAIGDRAGGGGADSSYRTLIRAQVKGTLDTTTLKFTNVDSVRGFYAISGPNFSAANDSDFTYSMYTVDGNATEGFQWKRWSRETGGTVPTVNSTLCTDGNLTCASSTDIGNAQEMQALVARTAETKTAWENLIASGKPLCEPAFNGAVDYSPVPTFLGNLGECDTGTADTGDVPGEFTCNQTHAQSFNRNCSTLFSANSLADAAAACALPEAQGGQGCCDSSNVFINAFGAVTSYEVVPRGVAKGSGTTYTCE